MSGENDQLTDHDYDGIKEYDNPLPTWWLVVFLGTIMFAFFYWVNYTVGGGPSLAEELGLAMREIKVLQAKSPHIELSEESLADKMKTVDLNSAGILYRARCQACHGENLQGVIGPNLTDAYWIHGHGTRKDIVAVIHAGVPEKGMPTWEGILTDEEIISVAALILAKQDSHPVNAKGPQGEKVR